MSISSELFFRFSVLELEIFQITLEKYFRDSRDFQINKLFLLSRIFLVCDLFNYTSIQICCLWKLYRKSRIKSKQTCIAISASHECTGWCLTKIRRVVKLRHAFSAKYLGNSIRCTSLKACLGKAKYKDRPKTENYSNIKSSVKILIFFIILEMCKIPWNPTGAGKSKCNPKNYQ